MMSSNSSESSNSELNKRKRSCPEFPNGGDGEEYGGTGKNRKLDNGSDENNDVNTDGSRKTQADFKKVVDDILRLTQSDHQAHIREYDIADLPSIKNNLQQACDAMVACLREVDCRMSAVTNQQTNNAMQKQPCDDLVSEAGQEIAAAPSPKNLLTPTHRRILQNHFRAYINCLSVPNPDLIDEAVKTVPGLKGVSVFKANNHIRYVVAKTKNATKDPTVVCTKNKSGSRAYANHQPEVPIISAQYHAEDPPFTNQRLRSPIYVNRHSDVPIMSAQYQAGQPVTASITEKETEALRSAALERARRAAHVLNEDLDPTYRAGQPSTASVTERSLEQDDLRTAALERARRAVFVDVSSLPKDMIIEDGILVQRIPTPPPTPDVELPNIKQEQV